ncbi:MAG TPA: hypothetical protein VF145_04745 [Chitinophagaceae bacterium]
MEYLILFVLALYLVNASFCLIYFIKQQKLKTHEKAYWLFICIGFPLLGLGLYRYVARAGQRRELPGVK